MENGKITITHFVNPHLFWYKVDDADEEKLDALQRYENCIAQHLRKSQQSSQIKKLHSAASCFDVGDFVAIKYLPFNRYIRACIDHKYENDESESYVVWASDYGFPILTNAKYIHVLPKEYTKPLEGGIRCGGIVKLIAGEKDFDIEQNIFCVKPQKKWSRSACEKLMHLIDRSDSISFSEKFHSEKTGMYWGELIIKTKADTEIRASEFLINLDLAIKVPNTMQFKRTVCKSEGIVSHRRWTDNENKPKYEKNEKSSSNKVEQEQNFSKTASTDLGKGLKDDMDSDDLPYDGWSMNDDLSDVSPNKRLATLIDMKPSKPSMIPKSKDFDLCTKERHLNRAMKNIKIAQSEDKENKAFTKLDDAASVSSVPSVSSSVRQQLKFKKIRAKYASSAASEKSDFDDESGVLNKSNCSVDSMIPSIESSMCKAARIKAKFSKNAIKKEKDEANKKESFGVNMNPEFELKKLGVSSEIFKDETSPEESNIHSKQVENFNAKLDSEILSEFHSERVNTRISKIKTLPAGYDLTKENIYKNENKHWHRVKTTLNNDNTIEDADTSDFIKFEKTASIKTPLKEQFEENFDWSSSDPETFSDPKAHLENMLSQKIQSESFLLAHGVEENLPRCDSLRDSGLSPLVIDVMQKENYNKITPVQSYVWPHITKGNSVLIVNSRGSGKTLSYLPAICSILYKYKNAELNGHGIESGTGPIFVVLAANCQASANVARLLCRFTSNFKPSVEIVRLYGKREFQEIKIQLITGCDILVTTPASFLRLASESKNLSLFEPKRIKHYVIDDVDALLSRSESDFKNLFREIFALGKQSATFPQLVVTASHFNTKIQQVMSYGMQPLILIGDFIEAAIYGKVQIRLVLCKKKEKLLVVSSFIELHPIEKESLMIICKDDEIYEISEFLNSEGIQTILFYSQSSADDERAVKHWSTKPSKKSVLICSSLYLHDLNIRNITNLIHYSLPETWSKFKNRFIVFMDSYENIAKKYQKKNINSIDKRIQQFSIVLCDESNELELPNLVDLQKRVIKKENHIDPKLVEVANSIIYKRDQERTKNQLLLCPKLLQFGECPVKRDCKYRHILNEMDTVSSKHRIPHSGDIKFKILKVKSPTHYTVRLLEYKPEKSTKWQIARESNKIELFNFELSLHYADSANLDSYSPIKLGEICIYKEDEIYHRAIVLREPRVESMKVDIRLIDTGDVINVPRTRLFHCHKLFKEFPGQAIDLRLLNIVPFDKEYDWDEDLIKEIESLFTLENDETVTANVTYSMSYCIWVKNIFITKHLSSLNTNIIRLELKQKLLENDYGCEDETVYKKLSEFLNNEVEQEEQEEEEEEVESSSFDISWDPLPIKGIEDWSIDGAPYIGIESSAESDNQNPVVIQKSDNFDKPSKPSTDIKSLEQWSFLPLHELCPVKISLESDWYNIYIKRSDHEYTEQYDELLRLIKFFVEEQKTLNSDPIDLNDLQPLGNYIIKYRNDYVRAKLLTVYGSNPKDRLYQFFLCDEGVFVKAKESELLYDFLYRSSNDIVSFLPYGTMHCRLIGIKLDEYACGMDDSGKHLFALADQEKLCDSSQLKDLKINSYQILLYESEKRRVNDVKDLKLINKRLVKSGLATYDPATKHKLSLVLDIPIAEWENNDCIWEEPDDKNQLKEVCSKFKETVNEVTYCENEFKKKNDIEPVTSLDGCESEIFKETQRLFDEISKLDASRDQDAVESKEEEASSMNQLKSKNESDTLKSTEANTDVIIQPVQQTLCNHKKPITTWYETDSMVFFSIRAPDIVSYCLRVTSQSLYFATIIDEEEYKMHLNLFRAIDPQYTSHEIRGINVVVRLVKSVYKTWPRLLTTGDKLPWLKYNFDALNLNENDGVFYEINKAGTSKGNAVYGADDDDESSDEIDDFNTFHEFSNKYKDLDDNIMI